MVAAHSPTCAARHVDGRGKVPLGFMWVRAIPPPTGRGHAALPQSAAWPAVPAARPFCFAAPHFRPPHWFRLWCIPTSGSWTLTCPSRSRPLTARHACGRNRMQFAVRQLQVQAQPLHARLAHQRLQLARLHGALLPQALPDSCTNLCHRRLGHLRNRFSLLRPRWAKVHTPAAEREGAAEALRGWHMGPAGWTAGGDDGENVVRGLTVCPDNGPTSCEESACGTVTYRWF